MWLVAVCGGVFELLLLLLLLLLLCVFDCVVVQFVPINCGRWCMCVSVVCYVSVWLHVCVCVHVWLRICVDGLLCGGWVFGVCVTICNICASAVYCWCVWLSGRVCDCVCGGGVFMCVVCMPVSTHG